MFRKFISTFLVLIFASLAAPLLFAWQLHDSFTDPDFYTDDFYVAAHDVFVDEAVKFVVREELSIVQDDNEIEALVSLAVDQDNFNEMLKGVADQFWNTDLGGASEVKIDFDFASLLSDNSAFYEELFAYMIVKLPPCVPDEVVTEPWSCIDPAMAKDDFAAKVRSTLDRELFANIPNNFLVGLPFPVEHTFSDFDDAAASTIFSFYLTLMFVIMGALALVIYRPWQKIVLWQFVSIFFAALHLIALSLITILLFNQLDPPVSDFLHFTFGLIAERLLYYYALPVAVLAGLAWVLIFVRIRNKDTQV